MRILRGLVTLGIATAALAAIPIAPVAPEIGAKARDAARVAFSSSDALRQADVAAPGLAVGPRLWAASAETRKSFKSEIKDVYAIVSSPQIITKWGLSPVDLATIQDPTLRSLLTEGAKAGKPVVAGAIMSRGGDVLSTIVLGQVKTSEFPFAVRPPTESEIQYYYSLIPYELTDPILVVESDAHAFLCHFNEKTKLLYFEMLLPSQHAA